MKKIAILRCLHSNDVCTGAACLKAFNDRSGSFSAYKNEELQLVAFWACNGCRECRLENEIGLEEKLQRIISIKTDIVHVGVCTKQRSVNGIRQTCPTIKELCNRIEASGIKIVQVTH